MWSVCVIARDEEERIVPCLASIPAGVERVVVVDSRTTDGTARWATRLGARVLVRGFDDYSTQRNAGLSVCSGTWVLFLDADERLSEGARSVVSEEPGPAIAGLSFPFRTRWLGRTLTGGRMGRDRKVRAVRRGHGRWEGTVHERLVVDGAVAPVSGMIEHEPYRDWTEHAAAIDRYATLQAARLSRHRRVGRGEALVRAGWHLVDALALRGGWRDGPDGVAVAGAGAASVWTKWNRARR